MLFRIAFAIASLGLTCSACVADTRPPDIRNIDSSLEFHTHIDRAPDDAAHWPSWERDAKTNPEIARIVGRYLRRPDEELYNLDSDPDEFVNLAGKPEHAAELQRLRIAVDEWMDSLEDKGMTTELARRPPPKVKKATAVEAKTNHPKP